MFSRQQVGTLPKRVSTTKMSNAPWSRQSLNLFTYQEPAAADEQQHEADGENAGQQQQQQQHAAPEKHRSGDNNIFTKPSTRVHAAPGGRSSVASLLGGAAPAPAPAPAARRPSAISSLIQQEPAQQEQRSRASSRVLAVPGGKSSMGKIFGGAASPTPAPKPSKAPASSNIFATAEPAARSSTRRIAVPGGGSEMDKVIAHKCEPEKAHGIRTGKTNVSNHVVNLTPVPVRPVTSRTARINQESHAESTHAQPQQRFAARQKALASNIFSFDIEEAAAVPQPQPQQAAPQPQPQQAAPQPQPQPQQAAAAPQAALPQPAPAAAAESTTLHGTGKPSTKVHHAPGGRSSGNLISW